MNNKVSLRIMAHQPRNYKWCIVPLCKNTSTNSPDKVFVYVPKNERRRKAWIKAVCRDEHQGKISAKTVCFVCEDHFNLEEDMENYMRFRMIGGPVIMKDHIVPHIFDYQPRITASSPKPRTAVKKINRKRATEAALAHTSDHSGDHAAKQRHLKRVAVPSLNLPRTSPAVEDLKRGQRCKKSRTKVMAASLDSGMEAQQCAYKTAKELNVSEKVEALGESKQLEMDIKKEANDRLSMPHPGNIPQEEVITDDIPPQEMLMPVPVKLVEVSTGKEIHFNNPLHSASEEKDREIEHLVSPKSEKEAENIYEPTIIFIPQKVKEENYEPSASDEEECEADFS